MKVLGKVCCLLCSPSLSTREVVTLVSGNVFDHSVAQNPLRDVSNCTNPTSLLGNEEMQRCECFLPSAAREGLAVPWDRGTEGCGCDRGPCAHSSDSFCVNSFCGAIPDNGFPVLQGTTPSEQQCVCDHRAGPQPA